MGGRGTEETRLVRPPEQKVRSFAAQAPLLLSVGPAGALACSAVAAAVIAPATEKKLLLVLMNL